MKLQQAVQKLKDIGLIDAQQQRGRGHRTSEVTKRKWSQVLMNDTAVQTLQKLKVHSTTFPK